MIEDIVGAVVEVAAEAATGHTQRRKSPWKAVVIVVVVVALIGVGLYFTGHW